MDGWLVGRLFFHNPSKKGWEIILPISIFLLTLMINCTIKISVPLKTDFIVFRPPESETDQLEIETNLLEIETNLLEIVTA